MDISKGYLRLFRQMLEWEWYDKPNTKAIFIHCLLCANQTDKEWQGIKIKRGQFITSLEKLAMANGLTIRQTRTALNDIQKTGEIDKQTTNRYSVITVKNYDLYQASDKQKTHLSDKQTTSKLTGKRQQLIRNSNTSYINISLSIEEREKLKKYIFAKKKNVKDADAYIRKLIENGDIVSLQQKAEKWEERQKEKNINNEILCFAQNNNTESKEEVKAAMQKAREFIEKRRRQK